MPADPRVQELLDQVFDSGATPEEVCQSCPELLPEVRARCRRMGHIRAELAALFPPGLTLETSTPSLQANRVLPRIPGYEVEAVLGQGGAGVVFRARNLRLGRRVALKMLLAGAYAGPTELGRFQREAEAVAGLCHPNIVQIYEVGDHEGRPYFTMELVDGGNLAQKLTTAPPPVRRAAELVASLADAVAVAHSAGIVHRDLKPANVLLTPDGIPKISDFGLARRVAGEERLTWNGTAVGTPSYMAPEQASGNTGRIGTATDVYGLGAVLYELLTGRPPFRGGTALETFQQVLSDEPVCPSRLNPRVPRDLETVCLKCLQKDPQRRYSSAADLTEDLRRYLLGKVVAARPVGNWEKVGKWIRRNPAVASLAAAAVLALVAGTVASLLFALEAGRQATELKEKTRVAEEAARRASENEQEATQALLSGLLIPIGGNSLRLDEPVDAAEGEALRQLRATRAPIRLQFLETALRDPQTARRVGRRADWVVQGVVGRDRALRADVERLLVRRIQEPAA
ncbi:MAG TPA: serine/threonine-protein kinase, partial [Gemmataceae bacterium]|nr:serine/threonine-protein kinase [Gemmataceae bacterium]